MNSEIRKWRAGSLGRLGGGFVMVVGATVIIASLVIGVTTKPPRVELPVVMGLIGAVACWIGYSYVFRCQIVLTGSELIVVDIFETTRLPLASVDGVYVSRTGLVFTTSDGRRCSSTVIQTGLLAQALGRHRRADEVRKAVMTAAGRRA